MGFWFNHFAGKMVVYGEFTDDLELHGQEAYTRTVKSTDRYSVSFAVMEFMPVADSTMQVSTLPPRVRSASIAARTDADPVGDVYASTLASAGRSVARATITVTVNTISTAPRFIAR